MKLSISKLIYQNTGWKAIQIQPLPQVPHRKIEPEPPTKPAMAGKLFQSNAISATYNI